MQTKLRLSILGVIAIIAVVIACNKDKFSSIPQLTFKSTNTTRLKQGQIVFNLNFTDKDGDITDTLWYKKVSYTCPNIGDSVFIMPNFPHNKYLEGEIEIKFDYNVQAGGNLIQNTCIGTASDSCYFKFWLHDNDHHTSDTARSPTIVLLQ